MKIKISHVTNSSSVSFVAYGIRCYRDDLDPKIVEKIKEKYKEINPDKEDLDDDGDYMLYSIASKLGLDYSSGPNSDEILLGGSLSSMRDDQSKLDLKIEVAKTLNELGFDVTTENIEYIEESWRDG